MTDDEFTDWLEYHSAAFAGLRDWLAKLGDRDRPATLAHWRRVLGDVDLDDARAATESLFSGEEPEPKSRDRIPATVRAIASRRRRARNAAAERRTWRPIDGEQTVACAECGDSGERICWHPATMQAVADGKFPGNPKSIEGTAYSCAVPCSCAKGEVRARRYPKWQRFRFDPEKWCEIDFGRWDRRDVAKLVEFVKARTGAAF